MKVKVGQYWRFTPDYRKPKLNAIYKIQSIKDSHCSLYHITNNCQVGNQYEIINFTDKSWQHLPAYNTPLAKALGGEE